MTLSEILKQKDSQIVEFWSDILIPKGFILKHDWGTTIVFRKGGLEVKLDFENPWFLRVTHIIRKGDRQWFLDATIRKEDIEDGILDVLR